VWQRAVSSDAVLVADALRPLSFHRLVETLHLSIPASEQLGVCTVGVERLISREDELTPVPGTGLSAQT
jgi:2-C-methyl-D-erythritol 4-phosphate cytidylyltransferase